MKMILNRLFSNPYSIRYIAYKVYQRFITGYTREHYYYAIFNAAKLARSLEIPRISILEFGVAGGNGLVEIERVCNIVSRKTGVDFEIYGFDTGEGLPPPEDYRDLPYQWQEGFFRMDVDLLKSRLTSARLVMGNVRETVPAFVSSQAAAPIGAIMFDLDYYSSTRDAFLLFAGEDKGRYLPRIQCYFDDIGTIDSIGVNLAISEFNSSNKNKKIENPLAIRYKREHRDWGWTMYEYHDFDHPLYAKPIVKDDQLPLRK